MGKTRETTNEIDPYLSGKERANLDRAEKAALIPFLPNMGGTVAGFTPTQLDAFKMGDSAASAFGFAPSGYTPPEGEMNRGIMTHSPGDWYTDMKNESVSKPVQNYIDSFFIDPETGRRPGSNNRRGARLNPLTNPFAMTAREANAGAHGDGNSSYGGGAGYSKNPYNDPVSLGWEQYGNNPGLANRALGGINQGRDFAREAVGGGNSGGGGK